MGMDFKKKSSGYLTDLWAEAVTIDGRHSRAEVSSTVQVVMGRV